MDRDELLKVCTYIAASAEGLKNAPKDYGPLRLLEVLVRLGDLAVGEYEDKFLKRTIAEVKKNQDLLMTDRDGFYRFLSELVVAFVSEGKRRRRSEGGGRARATLNS